MAAWNTECLAMWTGHDGMVRRADSEFRGPAFDGDVTDADGDVVARLANSAWGFPIVQIKLTKTTLDGKIVVAALDEDGVPC